MANNHKNRGVDIVAYIKIDETGRLTAVSEEFHVDEENEIEIDLPDGFVLTEHMHYIYQDGQLVRDDLPPDPTIEIGELRLKLNATDYIVTKIAEAQVTGRVLPEEDATRYADILIQREQWRAQINELEAQMEEV